MARDNTYDIFKKNKSSRLKRFRHFLEYWVATSLVGFAGLWPIKINQFFGTLVGLLAYKTARKDRGIALYQLDFCFPDLSDKEKNRIVKDVFINLGKTLFETLVIRKFRKSRDKWIKLENAEVVSAASKIGKGTILVFGHIANWELLVIACEMVDIHGVTVGSALGTKNLDRILEENRKSANIETLHRGSKMLPIHLVNCFRKNKFLILAFDQDMRVPSVFVDFFGRKASTSENIAVLAQKYNAPVVSVFSARQQDGTHQVFFELLSKGEYQGGREEILNLTQHYSDALEKHIRKYPSQWAWNHRRWKTQPDNN